MHKLVIITLVLSLVLVGCTGQDAAKNTTNAPDPDIGETFEDCTSHTDPSVSMEGIILDHVTSDPTIPKSTAQTHLKTAPTKLNHPSRQQKHQPHSQSQLR